jgi:putative spermidine/putrescine transport system ATP-binding protein
MKEAVRFEAVTKAFGAVTAADKVDLAIADGEFFSMLGPSGSGKTTCLRLMAGFETPDSGRIMLNGEDVSTLPPNARDVNTVFQDYALFPHMNVAENVGYGLMVKKTPEAERRDRVNEALALVHLEGLAERRPSQLSGGQRQRVALARALVNRPAVLLLDEPLGALDLKLRQAMQTELKNLQRQVGITFVFVTHDQEEALTMSDRIAVFNHGRIEQVGTPSEVYESPRNAFVAGFVGTSNVISGALALRLTGEDATFTVRPEKIAIGVEGECTVRGVLVETVYLGMYTRYRVDVDGQSLVAVAQNRASALSETHDTGEQITLSWEKDSCRRLADTTPVASGVAIGNDQEEDMTV